MFYSVRLLEPTRLFGSTSYVLPFFRSLHFSFSRWPTNQVEVEVSDSIFEAEAQPDIEIEAVEATEASEVKEAVEAIEAIEAAGHQNPVEVVEEKE